MWFSSQSLPPKGHGSRRTGLDDSGVPSDHLPKRRILEKKIKLAGKGTMKIGREIKAVTSPWTPTRILTVTGQKVTQLGWWPAACPGPSPSSKQSWLRSEGEQALE